MRRSVATIHIEQLRLRVQGLSSVEGQRLGELVAKTLRSRSSEFARLNLPEQFDISSISLEIKQRNHMSLVDLSNHIVSDLISHFGRSKKVREEL